MTELPQSLGYLLEISSFPQTQFRPRYTFGQFGGRMPRFRLQQALPFYYCLWPNSLCSRPANKALSLKQHQATSWTGLYVNGGIGFGIWALHHHVGGHWKLHHLRCANPRRQRLARRCRPWLRLSICLNFVAGVFGDEFQHRHSSDQALCSLATPRNNGLGQLAHELAGS